MLTPNAVTGIGEERTAHATFGRGCAAEGRRTGTATHSARLSSTTEFHQAPGVEHH